MVALGRLLLLLLLVTLSAALQVFGCRRRPELSARSENIGGGGSEGVKAAENANDVLSRHSVEPSESLKCGLAVAATLR